MCHYWLKCSECHRFCYTCDGNIDHAIESHDVEYIKDCEDITEAELRNAGWNAEEIKEVFNHE